MVSVMEVTTKKQQREFLDFPLELYKDCPYFVPPLYGDDLNIETVFVNPTTGGHCGPNGVGICFHAKHR